MLKMKKGLAALAIGLLAFCFTLLQPFKGAELSLQDRIWQREEPADGRIKIIVIDERTLEALGQFETWTREPYAELIEQLNQEGCAPAVIGFDILFVNEKGEEDEKLVEACSKYDNIVMASNLVFSTRLETEGGAVTYNRLHIDMVEEPFGELSGQVDAGFVNTVLDSADNRVRYALLERDGYRSFAAVIADKVQAAGVETDANGGMLIDYTAGAGGYETLSMIDVLEGRIPAEAFADSIVLVGAGAAGMGDSYEVPIEKGGRMYGVEIHANIIQALLEGKSLTNADPLPVAVICGLLAAGLMLLGFHVGIGMQLLASAGVLGLQGAACLLAERRGVMIPLLSLPVMVLLILVISIGNKYLSETLQKRKIIRAFQKYVAPQVVAEIAGKQDFQLKLGGEKRHIAVLFVDIRGFTSLSEALEPEQVVEILNEYLELVTHAIFKNGGTLDKFIGDAAMAVFNAPFESEDYIYKAVCTAGDIAAGSRALGDRFMERFGKRVSYGIGVNCGEAVVGNIGSEFRMDYTAIGDTVNTAARLEANAGPGQILISQAVFEQVKDRVEAAALGEIPLKGKAKGVMVYEVTRILRNGDEGEGAQGDGA